LPCNKLYTIYPSCRSFSTTISQSILDFHHGLLGAGLGLGTGALIGDRVQSLEKKQGDLDEQIKQNELELRRQRAELEKLKKETKER